MSDLVVVIPARGGSKRIKGKNIRPLAGKPLVHHAIDYALELEPRTIIVSTDSDEVAGVVRTMYGQVQIDRSFNHTDETTVDKLTEFYLHSSHTKLGDTLVVIQPTMIGDVTRCALDLARYVENNEGWWRLSGLRVVKGPRVGWRDGEGGINPAITLIDIDTMSDFAAAEALLRKKTTIGIYYKAGEKQGWGHEMRAKTLADALQDYDVTLVSVAEAFERPLLNPDIVIMDIGDTQPLNARGSKVITIEDNGPGARLAHASINPFTDLKYAVLRPEFYNLPEYVVDDNFQNILLVSGGQDNHDMIGLVLDALKDIDGLLVKMPTKGQMAYDMLSADLVICAGGQTAYEAIKVGVPTIVIPSLPTEAMRPHIRARNGIIPMGIEPSVDAIKSLVERIARDEMLRQDMSNRMKATQVGDGTLHIRRIIEDLCQP